MNLIVDTSVWSLLLRRDKRDETNPFVIQLRYHLERQTCIFLIGHILFELLDGVKSQHYFEVLAGYLEPFPLLEPVRADYVEAAKLKNQCRLKGVQAGAIDFLIAAVCCNYNYPLLTADNDFSHIAKHSKLRLIIP